MGMNPDGKIAYVTHWDEPGSVSVIDTKTNAVVETISVDPLPVSIAVDPGGETAYVYSAAGRTLTPIDTDTHAAGDPITVTGPSVDGTEAVVAITPNQSPVPRLAAPATAYVGDPVVFDASGSADDTDIDTYGFDFGDGAQATSAQPIRRHVYSEPGTYEATLTLDDGVGCEPVPELFGLGLASPFTGQTAHCSGPSLVTSEPVTIEVREPDKLRLLVGLARPQRSLRRVQVSAACGAIDCRVRASGKVRARHPSKKARTFELIPATSELTAGTAGMLRPAIPPAAREAARKAVAAGGKVKAKVRVVAKAPVHQTGVRVHWVRVLPR